jgi:hypothetical protein
MFGSSRNLLGPAMHPLMDIATEKTPMLSNFGRRKFTDSCQLIDGGLGHAKKPCHLHDGENFSVSGGARFGLTHRFSRYITVHND